MSKHTCCSCLGCRSKCSKVLKCILQVLAFPLGVIAVTLMTVVQFIMVIPLLLACVVLKVLEMLFCFSLPPPYVNVNPLVKVLLLRDPTEASQFMSQNLSDNLVSTCQEFSKANHTRIRVLVSDSQLKDEWEEYTRNPAELLFWAVFYQYPYFNYVQRDGFLHFQASLMLTDMTPEVEEQVKQTLVEMGFAIEEYTTRMSMYVDSSKPDGHALLCFGRSRWWSIPNAQRLFFIEIKNILLKHMNIQKRIVFWTDPGKNGNLLPHKHGNHTMNWFSYEAHGSIKDMCFKTWKKNMSAASYFWLSLAGYTNILYAGLERNRALQEIKVSFSQLCELMGLPMAILISSYKAMCGSCQSATAGAMFYRAHVFDYRSEEAKEKEARDERARNKCCSCRCKCCHCC